MKTASELAVLPHARLVESLSSAGFPAYRANQIREWLYRRWETDPTAMKNLPQELRESLPNLFACCLMLCEKSILASDGTKKILLRMPDGEAVESVIIPSRKRTTFCLSTQVGCPVRCRFCASGIAGFVRNLSAGEIVEQLLLTCRVAGTRPDNLVIMGIGEPLMNYDNLVEALHIICDGAAFAMSPRRVTVSTSGLPEGIRRLADEGRQWHLAVSLHGPDDATRAALIPQGARRPITEILDACRYYRNRTGRIVTFEYVLLAGVNDAAEQAAKFADLVLSCRAKANLIPYNELVDLPFSRPDRETICRFESIVRDCGVPVTRRREMGGDVNAACGQLRHHADISGKTREA